VRHFIGVVFNVINSTLSSSRLKMQQNIRTLKDISCVGMIALCPRKVWWSWVHAPL